MFIHLQIVYQNSPVRQLGAYYKCLMSREAESLPVILSLQ